MNRPETTQGGDQAYWHLHNGVKFLMERLNIQVEGRENAEALNDINEGSIIMPSHTSIIDELALTSFDFDRPMRFMGKAEIWKQRRYILTGVRYAAKKAKAYPVKRGDARSAVESFKTSLDMVDSGELLVIHAEGTRNKNSDPRTILKTKTGVARIALRAKGVTPVLPVGIGYRRNRLFKHASPYHIGIVAGKPIYVGHNDRPQSELYEQLNDELLSLKIRAVNLAENRK